MTKWMTDAANIDMRISHKNLVVHEYILENGLRKKGDFTDAED